MIKSFKNSAKKKINIIPLIDIIFILLIFFMLATNFRMKENIDFSLKSTSGNSEQSDKKTLEIFIKNNAEVLIRNNVISLENPELISSNIKKVFFNEKFDEVLVLCNEIVNLQNLISIMDIIKEQNINNIFFTHVKNE